MKTKVTATLPAIARPLLEHRLPDWIEARWFKSKEEAWSLASEAEIGWFDLRSRAHMSQAIAAATRLRWLNSIFAGVDSMPLELLAERKVILTNGAGINAITIAEYVVMGMLNIAKGYRGVVEAQQRHEWLRDAPGTAELYGSKALILGFGAIGQLVEARLRAFGVEVSVVRRTPDASGKVLGPDQWRSRLGEFDWVILAVPATAETQHLIGASELAAMKPSAVLVNVARGTVIDQPALIEALRQQVIAAAFLDVTEPEPLPADHPLWELPNAHITMHLSGRSQTRMFERAAERFLVNLGHYRKGEPMTHQVNLALGY